MVGEEGLEPSQDYSYKILSLARLPIPPLAHIRYKPAKTKKVRRQAIRGVLYYTKSTKENKTIAGYTTKVQPGEQ